MALKIYNRDHFRKVIRFAVSVGLLKDLRDNLLRRRCSRMLFEKGSSNVLS